MARALRPIGRIYGAMALRRLARATPYKAQLPVVCVGNFTAGGTGKTPLSLALAGRLRALGQQPAFLTRGYGGSMREPTRVDLSAHTNRQVGDEALLLARFAQTIVARDRAAGAKVITAIVPRASVIVMDDGLQNPALAKSLSIAVVDSRRGVGNGEVIPAGPLRAPLDAQLEFVNAIVVNHAPGEAIEPDRGVMGWLRERFQGPVIAATTEAAGDLDWLRGARVIAYAGIANPARFYAMLRAHGAEILREHTLKDHHTYTDSDAAGLIAMAQGQEAQLVTTEKDLIRLLHARGPLAELRNMTRAVAIETRFAARELHRIDALLQAACLPA